MNKVITRLKNIVCHIEHRSVKLLGIHFVKSLNTVLVTGIHSNHVPAGSYEQAG
jgi:hypothetical protein